MYRDAFGDLGIGHLDLDAEAGRHTTGDIPNLDHFAPGKPAKQVHPM